MKHRAILFQIITFVAILTASAQIRVGADQIEKILPLVEGKKVGLAVNHTSVLSDPAHTHLIDHLIAHKVAVTKLYSPEHGLRGNAEAGASVASGRDSQTGLPLISLYGNSRKPSPQSLRGIDLMIIDFQDVGVRFYTYISTLFYVIEASAEANIPIVVLDRPNPHDTIDGEVRKDEKYSSFVSLLPIPTVHGLTMGEAALMINGEGWLKNGIQADITVIKVQGWKHGDPYSLPVPPSPNLQTDKAIAYYPTLCYFEGTNWSEGRGTSKPFEQIGYPDERFGSHHFRPVSTPSASNPKHKNRVCYGPDLSQYDWELGINLEVIIDAYKTSKRYGVNMFTRSKFFDLLAGSDRLRKQIIAGSSAEQIRKHWQPALQEYIQMRRKYLLYPDDRF